MNFTEVKGFMDKLTDWIIPGNSIVIYHKNQEVFRYSSGYADVENKIKMTGDELINIYSCSKLATVVAALQLYEKGKFSLDDPIYDYISEFKEMFVKGEDGNLLKTDTPITFRHLFTHTSGITYDYESEQLKALFKETNGTMPTVEVAKAIAKMPLAFEPGKHWGYSLAHDVLAAIVEIISGKRFSSYVKENVFEPIGINDVYYHRTPEITEKMAEQYRYVTDEAEGGNIVDVQISSQKSEGHLINEGKDVFLVFGDECDSGGAGIITSVPSYAKFGNVLAMGGTSSNGEQILEKKTIELLRTNQLSDEQLKDLNWTQLNGYGYGLGVRTLLDKEKSGFNGNRGEFGWGGAAGATILIDPDYEFSFFYAHHMLNPQEDYYQPRIRHAAYNCLLGN